MALIRCDFFSDVLQLGTSMTVLLPQASEEQIGAETTTRSGPPPVLYLLHGLSDDDTAWLHLGESSFVERLVTYLELAPTLRDKFTAMDYVDLRFGDRVFVRSKGQTAAVVKTGQEK